MEKRTWERELRKGAGKETLVVVYTFTPLLALTNSNLALKPLTLLSELAQFVLCFSIV